MKKLYILFIALGLFYSYAYPQDNFIEDKSILKEELAEFQPSLVDKKITKVNIVKPKRTKIGYIQLLTDVKAGETYTENLHKNIYLSLWETGLFKTIKVQPLLNENEQIDLTIQVEDKWTLLPIPYFSVADGGFLAGLAFMERNLFGWGKLIVITSGYGNLRYYAASVYQDDAFFSKDISLALVTSVTIVQYKDSSYGQAAIYFNDSPKVNDFIRKSHGLFFTSFATLGYTFPNKISPYIQVAYYLFDNSIKYSSEFEVTSNQIPSAWAVPISFGIAYKNLTPYGVLQKGLEGNVSYSLAAAFENNTGFFQYGSANLHYALGIDKNAINLFHAYLDARYGNAPLSYSSRLGGSTTTRTISRGSIRSIQYITSSLSHDINIFRNNKFGIIVDYGLDFAIYILNDYEPIQDPLLSSGVFIGSGLVLKEVAIPLLKVFAGYNFVANYMTFSVSVAAR